MTYEVESCGRCGAKIPESVHRQPRKQMFYRKLSGEVSASDEIRLCSMCLDDVWEFVFDADVDRSDKADPIPLERIGENVQKYIEELETLQEEIQE